MGLFNIILKTSSEHDLRRIDKKFISTILNSIEELSANPFSIQSKKMKDSESTYRLRIGDYRVLYQVDTNAKIIKVLHIRHRKDIYKK